MRELLQIIRQALRARPVRLIVHADRYGVTDVETVDGRQLGNAGAKVGDMLRVVDVDTRGVTAPES